MSACIVLYMSLCMSVCVWTMRRKPIRQELDARSRVALFHGTNVTASGALELDDEAINYDSMLKSGVKVVNLLVANLGPSKLQKRGFDTPMQLRTFGFDAGHLCDPSFCNECLVAYGRDAVVSAFVVTAGDAVALAGTESMLMLRISASDLLERCAGFPTEAISVLQQLPRGISLEGVTPLTLLDSGLRVNSLKSSGYGLQSIVKQTGATATDLAKLGFSF